MAGLLSGPKYKDPPPPLPMPDPQDANAKAAQRAQMELMRMRGGRESTILSPGSGDYSKQKLG